MLILQVSDLLKRQCTDSPKPLIFLIPSDTRLKKLVDERECLLEQVTIFLLFDKFSNGAPETMSRSPALASVIRDP